MSTKIARLMVVFVTVPICLLVLTANVRASELVWSMPATTDCSGQGGNGESYSDLCYNKNGVNSTVSWIHPNDPAIHFDVIVGHQYRFIETTDFSGVEGNFISNYLTDGQGYDYGLGKDWICSMDGCYYESWSKDFEATSTDLYFLQASACSSSTNCFTSNLTLTDLSSPENPTTNPLVIWSLPATTDCSGKGASGQIDNLCFNMIGTNSSAQIHPYTGKPTISIDVIPGHTYKFTEQTPFVGTGGDFISNYLTDGNNYDYGLGRDWICPTYSCYHGGWTKIFTAFTNVVFFTQGSSCSESTDCFTTNLQLIDLSNSETPFPTPTSIPTLAPSPTPNSVSKVFFAPGFGGSWNPDALINCKLDNYSGGWVLAPYAEEIYKPILKTLTTYGWDTKPFYYDWRKNISNNASLLSSFINTNTASREMVALIGHSMGGLVAVDYVTKYYGDTKTVGLLAVGSPLKGAVQSFPAWAGGDIWEDNFLTKIAMTLYLKRCGGIFSNNRAILQEQVPSVKNLLPSFGYLVDSKTRLPVVVQKNISNWFFNPSNLQNVNFKTLVGTGFNTLSQIPVKNPNKKDLLQNDWLDGKPAGKIFSSQGDGTVLTLSSMIDGNHNEVINQTHSGLVGSLEGMAKILEFLGTPASTILSSTFKEPYSALILIGHPSSFWVTDQYGNTEKDKGGMVAFVNPKSGKYILNLIPQSNNTLFIIAQFLPNGNVKYKEYNLLNFTPKSKTIEFDSQNPIEDPLN